MDLLTKQVAYEMEGKLNDPTLQPQVYLVPLSIRKTSSSPFNQYPILNDDEKERNDRWNKVERQCSKQRYSESVSSDQAPIGATQLTQHYKLCMKMFSENKINSTNVWNLRIIDYMKAILHDHTSLTNTFQVASATLDVSTKVYGVRVDDVCADGMKLANSMAVHVAPESRRFNENEGIEGGEKSIKDVDASKRKRLRRKSTALAKNIESLLAPVTPLPGISQLLLCESSAQSTGDMFLHKFSLNHGGSALNLCSKEKVFFPKEKPETFITDDKLIPNVFQMDIVNSEICPAFRNFVIDKWNSAEKDSPIKIATAQSQLGSPIFDSNGMPVPELDGTTICDMFCERNCCADMDVDFIESEIGNTLTDLRPRHRDDQSNEYLHNTSIVEHRAEISGLIFGPSHWKVKYFSKRVNSCYTGDFVEKMKPKPKVKRKNHEHVQEAPEHLTFDDSELELENMESNVNVKKSLLPNVDTYIDPEYFDENSSDLHRSLLDKDRVITYRDSESGTVKVKEVTYSENDYSELMDCDDLIDSDYCTQEQILQSANYTTDTDHCTQEHTLVINGNEMTSREGEWFYRNSVDAPELVPKNIVNFSIRPNRMDMKKLKASVWDTIRAKSTAEVGTPNLDKCLFSELYSDLQKKLTKEMGKQLSCPLAFVSILHLANEKNLTLEGVGNEVKILKQRKGVKRQIISDH